MRWRVLSCVVVALALGSAGSLAEPCDVCVAAIKPLVGASLSNRVETFAVDAVERIVLPRQSAASAREKLARDYDDIVEMMGDEFSAEYPTKETYIADMVEAVMQTPTAVTRRASVYFEGSNFRMTYAMDSDPDFGGRTNLIVKVCADKGYGVFETKEVNSAAAFALAGNHRLAPPTYWDVTEPPLHLDIFHAASFETKFFMATLAQRVRQPSEVEPPSAVAERFCCRTGAVHDVAVNMTRREGREAYDVHFVHPASGFPFYRVVFDVERPQYVYEREAYDFSTGTLVGALRCEGYEDFEVGSQTLAYPRRVRRESYDEAGALRETLLIDVERVYLPSWTNDPWSVEVPESFFFDDQRSGTTDKSSQQLPENESMPLR